MTKRPILFSAPMVRAILDGRKTQTRRPIDRLLDYGQITDFRSVLHLNATCECMWAFLDRHQRHQELALAGVFNRCPYGCMPGTRLWVRETWATTEQAGHAPCDSYPVYRATDPDWETMDGWKWKPSIHMPKWASRITLDITGMRIMPLNDISREDALAEGIRPDPCGGFHTEEGRHFHAADPRESFAMLWEQSYGEGSWDANHWVWAIDFKRVRP